MTTPAGTDRERVFSGYSGRLLLSVSLGWTLVQAGRFLLPPLLPTIMDDLGLTLVGTGMMLSGMQFVYALVNYPSGRLSDRLSRATLLVPGFVAITLAVLLIGGATGGLALLAGLALHGVGKGLYAVPARALVSDHFVAARGRALGLFAAGSDVGGMLASAIAVVVLGVATWRVPFIGVGIVLAVLGAVYVTTNREPVRVRRVELDLLDTVRRLLVHRRQREILLAYSLFYIMVNGVINFIPAYLQAEKGLAPGIASVAFGGLFVIGAVVKPSAGALSDRAPRSVVAAGGMTLGAVAITLLLVADGAVLLVASLALLAIGYKSQNPVLDAILLDAAPDEHAGGDLGAARALFLGIGSLGAAWVGAAAQYAGYAVAFGGLAACLVLSTAIMLRQWRRSRA